MHPSVICEEETTSLYLYSEIFFQGARSDGRPIFGDGTTSATVVIPPPGPHDHDGYWEVFHLVADRIIATAAGPINRTLPYFTDPCRREGLTSLVTAQLGTPFDATYNPCTPLLSMPQQILSLDPLWSNCTAYMRIVRDPPVILASSQGFFPPVTTPYISVSPPPDATKASPRPTIGQSVPTSTDPPAAYPTLPPPTNNPPASKVHNPPFSKNTPAITIGDMTITINSKGEVVIGPKTLKAGGKFTYSSITLSYASDGRLLDVDGTTHSLGMPGSTRTATRRSGTSTERDTIGGLSTSDGSAGKKPSQDVEEISGSSSTLDPPSSETIAKHKKLHNSAKGKVVDGHWSHWPMWIWLILAIGDII